MTDRRDKTLIRMQAILDFVKSYRDENLISPTMAEIAVGVGWQSKDVGNIHPLIEQLINAGFLERVAKGARTLVVSNNPPRPFFYRREDFAVEETT